MTTGDLVFTSDDATATLHVTRLIHAPRDRVWSSWTEADQLARWWGPPWCPVTSCTVDLRTGGTWHYILTGVDGTTHRVRATYLQVEPPDLLMYESEFVDAEGTALEEPPRTVEARVIFAEAGSALTALEATFRYATPDDLRTMTDHGTREGLARAFMTLDDLVADATT